MNGLKLAWQNILRNRRRSFVTILIATLGTASLLVAGGFALYSYDALREGAARDFGHLTVAHPDYFDRDEDVPMQYGLADHAALTASLVKDERVRRLLPRIAFSGLISNGDKSMIFVGNGVDIPGEAEARGPFLKFVAGTPPAADGGDVVLLGADLAKSLSDRPGSPLTLLVTTTAGSMNALDVEVAGIVSTGWRDLDKRLVYTGVSTAQRLLMTDKIGTLAVFLDRTDSTPGVLRELAAQDKAHVYKPWWEQAFYYQSVRELYNRIFGLLGIIIAALVFFSVANTLAMAVVERTREIGTLRALGALPAEIVGEFLREGALIGMVSTIVGMLVAAGISRMVLGLDIQMPPPPGRSETYPLKIYIDSGLYVFASVAVIVLCVAAAWVASRKASQKPIVEALGHV